MQFAGLLPLPVSHKTNFGSPIAIIVFLNIYDNFQIPLVAHGDYTL